jgi:hypothetical protein
MALKSKHPHIRIDQQIWDDPIMISLPSTAFKTYIFAIAWSKSQSGRTPDGILTLHGIRRIDADFEDLQELIDRKLLERVDGGYKILKYDQWQVLSSEEQAQAAKTEEKREVGRQSAAKRWTRPVSEPEAGFDADAAFVEAWDAWPDAVDPRYNEKREDAYESFCTNITNSKDWATFQAALMRRLKEFNAESKPKEIRRKFLGAFKNFCDGKWLNWIPKGYQESSRITPEVVGAPPPKPPAMEPGTPSADPLVDDLNKFLQQTEGAA